jgi:hypothetical protein
MNNELQIDVEKAQKKLARIQQAADDPNQPGFV